jgi:hypothetical protein
MDRFTIINVFITGKNTLALILLSTCSQSEFGPLCGVRIRIVRSARVILTPNTVHICRRIRFGVLRPLFAPKNESLHDLQDSNMFMMLFKPWNQENFGKIIYKRFKEKDFYRFTQHIYNLRLLYHNAYWYLYNDWHYSI